MKLLLKHIIDVGQGAKYASANFDRLINWDNLRKNCFLESVNTKKWRNYQKKKKQVSGNNIEIKVEWAVLVVFDRIL